VGTKPGSELVLGDRLTVSEAIEAYTQARRDELRATYEAEREREDEVRDLDDILNDILVHILNDILVPFTRVRAREEV
jgi:hypothetical protein